MPIKIFGYSYDEYKAMQMQKEPRRRHSLPWNVKALALFTHGSEIIMRCVYILLISYEVLHLNVQPIVAILRSCYWDCCSGILALFFAWLADVYVGKSIIFYTGFTLVTIGITILAACFYLATVDTIYEWLYYLGKTMTYSYYTIDPCKQIFFLEQFNLNDIEKMCLILVVVKYAGELLFSVLYFIFLKNKAFPFAMLTIFSLFLASFLIILVSVDSKFTHFPRQKQFVEAIIKCAVTYGIIREKTLMESKTKLDEIRNTILAKAVKDFQEEKEITLEFLMTQETIQHSNKILRLLIFSSPLIIYFLIAKMIYISWITKNYLKEKFIQNCLVVDICVTSLSIVAILIFEFCFVPCCFRKENNVKMTIKSFIISFTFLTFALVGVLVVQVASESDRSFVDVGALKIHNAMNVSATIDSSFTGLIVINQASTYLKKDVILKNEFGIATAVITKKKKKIRKTMVVKKNDVIVYVIATDGMFYRVDDFEPLMEEKDERKTQVLFLNGHKKKEIKLNFVKREGTKDHRIIEMPKLGAQLVESFNSGSYEVFSDSYSTKFLINFPKGGFSHVLSGEIVSSFEVSLPKIISPFWALPSMAAYGLSVSIVMVSYLRFVFLQSPPPLRVLSLAILSFQIHIVDGFFVLFWTVRHMNFYSMDYYILAFIYMCNAVYFVFIIVAVKFKLQTVRTKKK